MKKSEKKKRKGFMIYLNEEELNLVVDLVNRTSSEGCKKPISQVIRNVILIHAKIPDYDYMLLTDVRLNLTLDELKIREELFKCLNDNLLILKENGVELPKLENQKESK